MGLLSGRRGHARVVLMSIIGAEMQAVQTTLGATAEIGVDGVYTLPEYASKPDRQYPFVVARSADRSNTPANSSTRDILEWYQPEVVLVVGIGGGIQRPGTEPSTTSGPKVGDVVIGRYVHYADYTKNLPGASYLRYIALDQPSSRLIARHAEPVAAAPQSCFARLEVPRPDGADTYPKVHISEVVSAESIAGNPSGQKQIEMVQRFDNAEVVDMESMGVGRALHEYRNDPHYSPLWLPVRGISDIVTAANPPMPVPNAVGQDAADPQSDDNNEQRREWKWYASMAAACVARTIVERLLSLDRPRSPADPGAPRWPEDVSGQVDTKERERD